MIKTVESKEFIKQSIQKFNHGDFYENSLDFFGKSLGYPDKKKIRLNFNEIPEVKKIELLFQITDNVIKDIKEEFDNSSLENTIFKSYLFFSAELKKDHYSKTEISNITREINKVYKVPMMVLFKYGDLLTVAIVDRRKNKRDEEKHVLEKVTLIKDISIQNPHRGHIEILSDLSFSNLFDKYKFKTFEELHQAWQKTLDTSELNKKFYKELSNWYFWAIKQVKFPNEPTPQEAFEKKLKVEDMIQEHKAKNVIRMLTRLLFVWFIKEKNLIPESLFDLKSLQDDFLNEISPYHEDGLFQEANKDSIYYKAILQNLFFATLNCPIKATEENDDRVRSFRKLDNYGQHRGADFLMRYEKYFKNPQKFLEMVNDIVPFLNGGLFECLDDKENKKYIDGFSDNLPKTEILLVPDYLFFGRDENVDLSTEYGVKNKGTQEASVKGLINILKSYKFTVDENTPLEEEIALDPELLGKVFENLLASYNPETKTTARKQTGSFYTPREIVNYMVDESLIAYLKEKIIGVEDGKDALQCVSNNTQQCVSDTEDRLRKLFSYNQEEVNFSEEEKDLIIKELNNCKILDPACGSGAFPMGILHKMVHVLKKLDPDNTKWEKEQKEKTIGDKIKELEEDKKSIQNLKDEEVRNKAIEAVEEKLKEIEEVFRSENNFDDYSRKLYLIENCIYGVDIQPIATQISKLRFFISLIVDQVPDKNKDNFGIRPLPNLETKFVAANTLIGIEKPKSQMDIFSLDEELNKLEKDLKDNRHKLFSAKSPATKKRLREKDKDLREQMSGLLIKTGLSPENAKKLASWDPYNQNISSEFFDMDWMFGIHYGFDVVIGNPPYVQIQSFSGKQEQKDWQNQNYETFSKMGDIYSLFYEKGNMILREKGLLCFITSNKWMRAGYGENTRKYFAEKTNPLLLIDFGGYKVFESATVDTNILLFEKSNKSLNKNIKPNTLTRTKACAIQKDFNENTDINEYVNKNGVILEELNSENWIIVSKKEYDIKKRIEAIGTPLKDWDISINYGIKTGFNEAFIIDSKKKDELIQADPKNAEIIKPILRGRDIKKYKAEFADLWIIFIPWHFPLHNDNSIQGNSLKAEEEFKIQYPSLYKHFESYKKELSSRNKAETGIRYEWYALQRFAPTYYKDFEKEKIIWQEIVRGQSFYYDKNKIYPEATTFIMTGKNLKYLIALLNSNPCTNFFKKFYSGGGLGDEGFRYKKAFLENLPIPKISEEDMKPFEILVDFIMYAKEHGFESEANTFESVVDGLVYDLYFPEEMKKGGCYITDRIKETLKPFDSNDTEEEKKEYIQAVYKFCNADKIVYGGLIHRRNIDIVKVITGNNNE